MKCRDCENLIWSYDEGEWIWHCRECYCPDLDIERDCPDFALKKPDIFTALSTLQAENKRLNKIVCSIPTTPDSGRTVSQYDKEMSMCAYLDDLEAENEQLCSDLLRLQTERDTLLAENQHLLAERDADREED